MQKLKLRYLRAKQQPVKEARKGIGELVENLHKLEPVLDHVPGLLAFGGIALMYYNWEKNNRPPGEVFSWVLPQVGIDYMLLKSGTEAGVAAALVHMAARGFWELLENRPDPIKVIYEDLFGTPLYEVTPPSPLVPPPGVSQEEWRRRYYLPY